MPKYFYCKHCRKRKLKNPRLKVKQSYCGSGACQQARKNKWEREKLKKDHVYRKYRNGVKAKWRNTRPEDVYQRNYRESHPEYEQKNRHSSKDSRYWGFVPEDYIIGKAGIIFFSMDKSIEKTKIRMNRIFKKINSSN